MKSVKSELIGGFWGQWQSVNAQKAIFHQWEQLEKSGCIDNFRILAEGKDVFRRGWFFADSDAYKWLDAAFHILAQQLDPRLIELVDQFVGLIENAQTPDGYLYTYNQIHFPGTRWVNLQIEHELYCHGHLIEALISGAQLEMYADKLAIACRAADLIVADMKGKGPKFTSGHEEIEIALLKLFDLTHNLAYLEMAKQFLELRGKQRCFAVEILSETFSNNRRVKAVADQKTAFLEAHPAVRPPSLPASNRAEKPPNIQLRWFIKGLSGKLLQQHAPLRKQVRPEGHAVRFAYLQAAAAMLERMTGENVFRETMKKSWQHMVHKRMYITGGIGSLPVIEGFGRDYELDPSYAYAETCAALGSLFWNREMAKLSGDAPYSDLFEWQLYNAALVGMGINGMRYFYNNPLKSEGGLGRQAWYEVPCCPSNISRMLAGLAGDILKVDAGGVDIQQYISSRHEVLVDGERLAFEIESELPWEGGVQIRMKKATSKPFTINLRQPSWASEMQVAVNEDVIHHINRPGVTQLDPQNAAWVPVTRAWEEGDRIRLEFALPVQIYHTHEKVKPCRGQAALTRGPLVYCLESVDNPDVDIFAVVLDPESPQVVSAPDILGGIRLMRALSTDGKALTFIPYHLWGNRGPSGMTVFVNLPEQTR